MATRAGVWEGGAGGAGAGASARTMRLFLRSSSTKHSHRPIEAGSSLQNVPSIGIQQAHEELNLSRNKSLPNVPKTVRICIQRCCEAGMRFVFVFKGVVKQA